MTSNRRLFIGLATPGSRCVSLALLILCLAPVCVSAQSGRKLPDWTKKKPAPAPTPEAERTDTAQSAGNTQAKPGLPVVVTSYLPNINSSSILTNVVVDACLGRLSQSKLLAPTRGGQMNRKEASDRAKSMASGYVVWMELDADVADPESASVGRMDPSLLYVSFVVFNSGTGKMKSQGHVYQRETYSRLPGPVGQMGADYQLRQTGRETADRIMQAIEVLLPPGH
jgi:hypothetical protein